LFWLVLCCGVTFGWLKERGEFQHRISVLEQQIQDAGTSADMMRLVGNANTLRTRHWQFEISALVETLRIRNSADESVWKPRVAGASQEALAAYLEHSSDSARLAAVNELLKHGSDAVPDFAKALDDKNADVVWLALSGLHAQSRHAQAAVPRVRYTMQRYWSKVAAYAAYVLREIDVEIPGNPQKGIEFNLRVSHLSADGNAETRNWVEMLTAQKGYPKTVRAIVDTLRRKILGPQCEPKASSVALIHLFRDAKDDETREAAAFAFHRMSAHWRP
jgi:hypothetical protein